MVSSRSNYTVKPLGDRERMEVINHEQNASIACILKSATRKCPFFRIGASDSMLLLLRSILSKMTVSCS